MTRDSPIKRRNWLAAPVTPLWMVLPILLLPLSPAAEPHAQRLPFSARVVLGPVKIRPYAPLPPPADRPVLCARGEVCSFQVVVTASGEDLAGVDVSLSDLTGPRGVQLAASDSRTIGAIYREDFLNVFYRSSEQGNIGEWPDPLIPKVDLEYGETRRAFPFDLHRISPCYKRYRAEKGRSFPNGRGTGVAVSGGSYRGSLARRYVIEIVKPGALGVATFRWWSDPGSAQPSAERPVWAGATELDSGVSVSFQGNGREDDFLTGDEFWIFAGPSRNQPVWVDFLIPLRQPPGIYSGEVRITARDRPPLRVPLQIEVLDFELPLIKHLPNTFLMNWEALASAHFSEAHPDAQKDEARKIALGRAYATAALRNGITVTPSEDLAPTYTFNLAGSLAGADYGRYDGAVADFMKGSVAGLGNRWSSLPLPRLPHLTAAQRVAALRDFIRHARERGWYDRLYDYTYDEPSTPKDFEELKARARLLREIDPDLPRLVTTSLNPDLAGLVTRWCPVVNALEPKYSSPRERRKHSRPAAREQYDARLKAGESLWWYQSCESHGCAASGRSPQYDNWPSMMIDTSAAANRVFGFLTTVTYHVSGILYWEVAFAHTQSGAPGRPGLSPWESQYYFGGNGDGSLFYPGTPERVGGRHDIPIESLRLKMIRDSFYDAEYALLLRQLGEEEFLNKEVGRVVEKAWQWNADPQAWLELRERLGRRIALKASAPHR